MTTDFDKLIAVLEKRKSKGSDEYHFRPCSVDGVFCYVVLYFKFSVLTVESVHIVCKFSSEGQPYQQPYVLYYRKYKTFKDALELIQKITTNYKILNGDLESPENYDELKLEECVIPYSENERCSVCFENTTDTTICDHPICFNCREKCILKKQINCPICRNANVLQFYNNTLQLFNNRDSTELHRIFVNNPYKYLAPDDVDMPDDASVSSSEDEEEDEEEDEPIPVQEPIHIDVDPPINEAIVLVNDIMNDFDQI